MHKLIDCLLIKGRITDGTDPIPGTLRAYIPGRGSGGKLYLIGANGKLKVKIHGYKPFKRIRLVFNSPNMLELTVIIHPVSWIHSKGQFDGYKVIDLKRLVMTPEIPPGPRFLWYVQNPTEE